MGSNFISIFFLNSLVGRRAVSKNQANISQAVLIPRQYWSKMRFSAGKYLFPSRFFANLSSDHKQFIARFWHQAPTNFFRHFRWINFLSVAPFLGTGRPKVKKLQLFSSVWVSRIWTCLGKFTHTFLRFLNFSFFGCLVRIIRVRIKKGWEEKGGSHVI